MRVRREMCSFRHVAFIGMVFQLAVVADIQRHEPIRGVHEAPSKAEAVAGLAVDVPGTVCRWIGIESGVNLS